MTAWSIEYAFGLIRNSLTYYFYNSLFERDLIFNNLFVFFVLGILEVLFKNFDSFFRSRFHFYQMVPFLFFLPSEWSRDPNLAG